MQSSYLSHKSAGLSEQRGKYGEKDQHYKSIANSAVLFSETIHSSHHSLPHLVASSKSRILGFCGERKQIVLWRLLWHLKGSFEPAREAIHTVKKAITFFSYKENNTKQKTNTFFWVVTECNTHRPADITSMHHTACQQHASRCRVLHCPREKDKHV